MVVAFIETKVIIPVTDLTTQISTIPSSPQSLVINLHSTWNQIIHFHEHTHHQRLSSFTTNLTPPFGSPHLQQTNGIQIPLLQVLRIELATIMRPLLQVLRIKPTTAMSYQLETVLNLLQTAMVVYTRTYISVVDAKP